MYTLQLSYSIKLSVHVSTFNLNCDPFCLHCCCAIFFLIYEEFFIVGRVLFDVAVLLSSPFFNLFVGLGFLLLMNLLLLLVMVRGFGIGISIGTYCLFKLALFWCKELPEVLVTLIFCETSTFLLLHTILLYLYIVILGCVIVVSS